jgi:hypothetical protein
VLYGVVSALFSYCISLFMASPLSSFAVSAGYQVIMFVVSFRIVWSGLLVDQVAAVPRGISPDVHVRADVQG